jgi:hypothetical protein
MQGIKMPGRGKGESMRKPGIVAAVLAAGVIAVSGAQAQEIGFDGYVNTGIGVLWTDAKVADGTGTKAAGIRAVPFGVDSGQAGYRFRLNGSYTSGDGNTGAKIRLQAQRTFAAGVFSIPYAYGWASFFNKVLTVNGGLVDDSAWATKSPLHGDDLGEGLGILIKVSPIDGLTLEVGAYAISQQGGGSNNALVVPAGKASSTTPVKGADSSGNEITVNLPASPITDFSKVDIGPDRLKYTFNVGYTLPELLKVNLSFRTANQAGNAVSRYDDADQEKFDGAGETSALIFGAQVLAVKDLTAAVEAVADKLEDTGKDKDLDDINVDLYETLAYKLGDLSVGLNAAQNIRVSKDSAGDDEDHSLGVHINPWVSYAIGNIVPRLDLNYYLAGTALATGGDTVGSAYHRTVFAYKDRKGEDDVSVIAIRPSVKFNVGKGVIELGDLIALASGPDKFFADADDTAKNSNFTNVFYVDFKWSF